MKHNLFVTNKPNTMENFKLQHYSHCFIVRILGPYTFWLCVRKNVLTIVIRTLFRGTVLIRRETLIRRTSLFQFGYPKVRRLLKGSGYLRAGSY